MKPRDVIVSHFRELRRADDAYKANHHANFLYGYLQALLDTGELGGRAYIRLSSIATKAWVLKIERLPYARGRIL